MGTVVSIEIRAPEAADAAERVLRTIEGAERRLSTWRDDTELARLNRTPAGQAAPLSARTRADLADAHRWSVATAGAFDPAVGGLVALWDLRGTGRTPRAGDIAAVARGPASWRVTDDGAVRIGDVVLEEGAFGKGAALREALEREEARGMTGEIWINLGGQVARTGGTGVRRVPVADPRDRERVVLDVPLASGSLATSGNSERGRPGDGGMTGHILDPRTGRPVPAWGSMTVWHHDALAADALSTALYVMGPAAAIRWADAHPPARALALEAAPDGLVLHATATWRGDIRPCAALRRIWETQTRETEETSGEGK